MSLAERLTRLSELLVTMSASPVPTHLFQTLADHGSGPLPNDYLALCLASLGAVGLFISTLTEQPIGAMIAVLVFSTASFIADSIPQIDWIHPFLLTHNWLSFGDLLRSPITWSGVSHGLFSAAAYALVFWLAAWARFSAADVTS